MRALLLLPCVLLLLKPTDGNGNYNQLSEHERDIIGKAIRQANEQHEETKHLDFDSIIRANKDKKMLNVLLKPTSCDKMTQSVHREDCEIQSQAKPQVSCVDCRGQMSCYRLKETKEIEEAQTKCLNLPPENTGSHQTGAANSLFIFGESEKQTGCLGCI